MEEFILLLLTGFSLTVGIVAGLLSRVPNLGRGLGGYMFILTFAFFSIHFQLPHSFFIPPCLAAIPLKQRHPKFGKAYLLLLSGSFLFFVFFSFGVISVGAFLGWSSLMALLWAVLFVGYRNFEIQRNNSTLPIGISFFLLGVLAAELEKDAILILLCFTLSLYMVGLYLGAKTTQSLGNHTLRFIAFVYAGLGLLLSDQGREFLLIVGFALPFLLSIFPTQLTGNAKEVDKTQQQRIPYLLAVIGQLTFGFFLLTLSESWEVGLSIVALLLLLNKPWNRTQKSNEKTEPVKSIKL